EKLLNPRSAVLVAQTDSREVASEVKLTLLEVYPPHHPVTIVRAAEGVTMRVELAGLDATNAFDHLTSVFVPAMNESDIYDFRRLTELIAVLRGPGGCPWDRVQTHETLARHLIEESHEAIDAMQEGDAEHLAEELGDILLQVVLHAELGREEGVFDIRDSLYSIIVKLIHRHPHVFGEGRAGTPEEVIARWERIKADDQGHASVMDGVSAGLPALLYAYKLQARAARIGFDWPAGEDVLPKLAEELEELRQSLLQGADAVQEELGDMLFTIVNVCRHWRVDPEIALHRAAKKFARRFRYVEETAAREGLLVEEMTLPELDVLWERAKDNEGNG
ncbi:MAG: nucleoside triphosphate pyrophosphohydrolase, partial [Candidatus Geothermincolia bacterium]